ncbi:MAG: amino acid ABC transporter substrate-binding protein, partial [Chloroflexi bacterium]|nr:amino acid ABC transporter substrate-binding protein [Chloroflexota bacterium]
MISRLLNTLSARRGAVLISLIALVAVWIVPAAGAAAPAFQTNVLRIGYFGAAETDFANGAQLAIDQINASGGFTAADGTIYQLELITLEAPPTIDSFANDVLTLQSQKSVVFLGPDTNASLSPENTQYLVNTGIPVLSSATADTLTDDDPADVLFRVRAPERVYSNALATYLLDDLGLTSVALVQTDVDSTEALLDFDDVLTSRNVVAAAKMQLPDATGLADQAVALLDVNPEAVVLWGDPQDAALLLQILREGGWQGRFAYRLADEAARSGWLPVELAEGVIGVDSWNYAYAGDAAQVFMQDYLLSMAEVPGSLSVAGYDAVWYLRSVMVASGVQPTAIRAGLIGGAPLDLVAGTLRPADFANGDLLRMAMVYEIKAGGGANVVA